MSLFEFTNGGSDEALLKSLNHNEYEDLEKGLKNKAGLVQRQVTVNGKNGTHTRMQWVKASDVKKTDVVIGGQQPAADTKKPAIESVSYSDSELKSMKQGAVITRQLKSGKYAVYEKQDNNTTILGGWSCHTVSASGQVSQLTGVDTKDLIGKPDFVKTPKVVQDRMSDIHNVFLKTKADIKHKSDTVIDAQNKGAMKSAKFKTTFEHVQLPTSGYKEGDIITMYNPHKDRVIAYQCQGKGWSVDVVNSDGSISQLTGKDDNNMIALIKAANAGTGNLVGVNPTSSISSTLRSKVHNVFLKASPNVITGKPNSTNQATKTQDKTPVSKPKAESSSKKDENTSENRRKLKAEIDEYVHKHNPPTDADRKKVSAMRDKYNAWMKEESDRLKKQAQEQYKKTPDKADKPKNDKSSDTTKTKTPDEEFIDSKFNYAYKDDMSMPKKVEKIQVGDKTGYIVTREVQRDGGDHSYSGTVYSAVIDGKAIKASDDETPINLEDNTAFKTRDDCLKALKAQGKNTSDKQPAKADNTKADTTTKKPLVDAKALVKKMSADQAEQFAKDNNITWTKNDHSGINTMRMKMAIQSAIEDGSVEAPDLGNMPSKPTKTDKSSAGAKKPQDDAKKAVQDAIGKNPDRAKAMEKFKANGITWKESDKEGINWMRAMMAATKHVADGGKIEDNASGTPAKSETKPKLSDPTTPTKPSDIKVGDYIYYEDNEGAGRIKGVTQVKDIKTVVVPKTGKTMYIFNQYGRHDRVACTESKTVKKYN